MRKVAHDEFCRLAPDLTGPDAPLEAGELGWTAFFADQLTPDEAGLVACRISSVHRSRLDALCALGPVDLTLPAKANTGEFAVGDWVLADPVSNMLVRRLERKTALQRRTENRKGPQLAAANVDTLFIVSSLNADFNIERLERYLVMAAEAGTVPVLVLTKADLVDDAEHFVAEARQLKDGLAVVLVNARAAGDVAALAPWCGKGQTVALVGSSGVGKSTLVNSLTGHGPETGQKTAAIREHDSQGRHTTTARSLHRIAGGGWVIDTPGIRTLHVSDVTEGIDLLFDDIAELALSCKFRNCTHGREPGCAIRAAIADGSVETARFERWQALESENRDKTPVMSGPKGNKIVKRVR